MVRRQPGGHRLASQRCVATHASPAIKELVDDYEKRRAAFEPTKTLPKQSTRNVFANNLLRLGQVEVIGFDYDYTLCHYTEELQRLIYNMARDAMVHDVHICLFVHAAYSVHKLRYPHALLGALEYDPSFAIRGLAIDTEKALLCKISSHQKLSYTEVHTSGKMHKAVVQDLPLYMEPNTKLRELLSRFQLQEADVHDDEATDDGRPHDAADAVYHHYVNLHSELQMEMEALINPNFGSVFRVESHPSQFAFSAQRYVDIYSSRLKNFLEYPKNYTFYPERMRLPHEPTPQPPM
ncbi:hypothetical protein B5M09_006623 [Aphanomyces astaci]|uniref:5'-nucleotidase n=1 Tax=Aphanomyces astaci TaxID=112090 RepID=A0A3R7XZS2_APHAT|nr:hypothetical protein B5M09_006623 [Aphanomyces astaci]